MKYILFTKNPKSYFLIKIKLICYEVTLYKYRYTDRRNNHNVARIIIES